jgi:DNA-binding NtrC family response regulator
MRKSNDKQVRFPDETLSCLYRYSWPGNVRELKNCVENGVIMAQSQFFDLSYLTQLIDNDSLPASQTGSSELLSSPNSATLKEALQRAEKEYLLRTLDLCGGHRLKAMSLLGLSKRTFYRKMRYHGLTS